MISHTGEVLNTAASDKNYTVFLKVVSDSGNVSGNFDSVGESDSGNLSKSLIRLLRSYSLNRCANASLLRGMCVCSNSS